MFCPATDGHQPGLPITQPRLSTTQPSLTNMQPSLSVTQPSLSVTQLSLSVTQPSLSITQPSLSITQPSLTTTQPSLTTTQPILSITQPSLTKVQKYSECTSGNLQANRARISDKTCGWSDNGQRLVYELKPETDAPCWSHGALQHSGRLGRDAANLAFKSHPSKSQGVQR